MSRFSIIVPNLGANSDFEATLASILRYRPDHTQVVVVHQGSYSDPYGLAREVDFIEVDAPHSGLIEMFNAGVRAARGSILGILRPGVQLTDSWEVPVDTAFSNSAVACVSPAIVLTTDRNRLVAAGVTPGAGYSRIVAGTNQKPVAFSTSNLKPLGPISWGGFYRKSYLASLDECDVNLDANYFDLDLALSLAVLNFKNEFVPNCVLTCETGREILAEAKIPHGCSTQRAAVRFGRRLTTAPAPTWIGALLQDLFSWPWNWNHSQNFRQRAQADQFRDVDKHYQQLLELLIDQRSRLIAPGLHSRVAAQQRSSMTNHRRAA